MNTRNMTIAIAAPILRPCIPASAADETHGGGNLPLAMACVMAILAHSSEQNLMPGAALGFTKHCLPSGFPQTLQLVFYATCLYLRTLPVIIFTIPVVSAANLSANVPELLPFLIIPSILHSRLALAVSTWTDGVPVS